MMVTDQNDTVWLDAGRVMRAHGVRGELRVELDLACDALVGHLVRLLPRAGEPQIVTLTGGRSVHEAALVTFDKVETREAAQALSGARLQLQQADIPPTEPGEYYIYELQGAAALDEAGRLIGRVIRIDDNQGQALLVLAGESGDEFMLPLVPALVKRFDRPSHTLHIVVPEGLWED